MPIIKAQKLNQVTQKWEEEEIEDTYLSPLPLTDIDEQINKACDNIVEISLKMTSNINKKMEKD
jgi:hypothetical protein